MPTYDFTRLLIEGCVSRTLRQMKQDGRRSIRNLIDLGLHFTQGQHQRHFLEAAQGVLENEESAYYHLVEQLMERVRPEHLKTFSVNLGYEGLTHGARVIRRTGADHGYSVPWCLAISFGRMGLDFAAVSEIVRQGMQEGIYVYFLFSCGVSLVELQELMDQFPLCAFIFLTTGDELLSQPLDTISDCANLYVTVRADEAGLRAAEALSGENLFYGIYHAYRDAGCVTAEALDAYLDFQPSGVLLLPDGPEYFSVSEKVYEQVVAERMAQEHPFILFEFLNDLLYVSRVISGEDAGVLHIMEDGSAVKISGAGSMEQVGNVKKDPLTKILRRSGGRQ